LRILDITKTPGNGRYIGEISTDGRSVKNYNQPAAYGSLSWRFLMTPTLSSGGNAGNRRTTSILAHRPAILTGDRPTSPYNSRCKSPTPLSLPEISTAKAGQQPALRQEIGRTARPLINYDTRTGSIERKIMRPLGVILEAAARVGASRSRQRYGHQG
jgi:hypothetical protein